MISVENFYWVLYENLLKPAGVDCWYYFPFGTTQNLSNVGVFSEWHPMYEHHALFHFDQEPIISTSLGKHYDGHLSLSCSHRTKILKLLANSEHSLIKKQICRERSMADWYYFFHGFAAHDWFRDARYLPDHPAPKKVFCSFNHLTDRLRSYRMALTARLAEKRLLDYADISFHATRKTCQEEICSTISKLSDRSKQAIQTQLIDSGLTLPIILDHAEIDGSFSARFGREEYRIWQNSFWHVVNETVFYDPKLHLTEKIFKPIVSCRPFILVAAPGNLNYLKSYGFKTFDRWIDESYDDIHDVDLRLDAVVKNLEYLCNLSYTQLNSMLCDMTDVLVYNKNHFFNQFQHLIVDELVDNFDGCVKVWNNGLLNPDRLVRHDYDTEGIKNLLKCSA
jgi:hypothetical protein